MGRRNPNKRRGSMVQSRPASSLGGRALDEASPPPPTGPTGHTLTVPQPRGRSTSPAPREEKKSPASVASPLPQPQAAINSAPRTSSLAPAAHDDTTSGAIPVESPVTPALPRAHPFLRYDATNVINDDTWLTLISRALPADITFVGALVLTEQWLAFELLPEPLWFNVATFASEKLKIKIEQDTMGDFAPQYHSLTSYILSDLWAFLRSICLKDLDRLCRAKGIFLVDAETVVRRPFAALQFQSRLTRSKLRGVARVAGRGKDSITKEPNPKTAWSLVATLLRIGSKCGQCCEAIDIDDACECPVHVLRKYPQDPETPSCSIWPADDDFNLARMYALRMVYAEARHPVTSVIVPLERLIGSSRSAAARGPTTVLPSGDVSAPGALTGPSVGMSVSKIIAGPASIPVPVPIPVPAESASAPAKTAQSTPASARTRHRHKRVAARSIADADAADRGGVAAMREQPRADYLTQAPPPVQMMSTAKAGVLAQAAHPASPLVPSTIGCSITSPPVAPRGITPTPARRPPFGTPASTPSNSLTSRTAAAALAENPYPAGATMPAAEPNSSRNVTKPEPFTFAPPAPSSNACIVA